MDSQEDTNNKRTYLYNKMSCSDRYNEELQQRRETRWVVRKVFSEVIYLSQDLRSEGVCSVSIKGIS